ncbi:unnamed protein product [Nezara viridula]|uniref:Hexosyltransferase n=1 Tax=Nezara viridula TaxID=85310 RepID=A0A9P0MUD6_NEZVI|nr:unnamed protein product [Nezara viridula]
MKRINKLTNEGNASITGYNGGTLHSTAAGQSVDSRKAHFIGQAGRGNQEEFGLLSLEYDENFCMGGPGVIMSREVLARVAPHIRYCLKNLYTTHEDVELGRCVQKFAGVSCTWSYEVRKLV